MMTMGRSCSDFLSAPIPGVFASQVEQHPDAPAVSWAGGTISYAELDTRSRAVAQARRGAGLASNEPVALYMESSVEQVIAALGVWMAGGAYLPIDPAYPAERATFILSDSGAPVMICRRRHATALGAGPWRMICIDRSWYRVHFSPMKDRFGRSVG